MVNAKGVWHKQGVMPSRPAHRPRPPLTSQKLEELALHYVGRFATSRSKFVAYLNRKVRERGWSGEARPDFDGVAERLCRLGYVDDAAFAVSKARALTGRGYGARRVGQALHAAGISEEDGSDARDFADAERVDAAIKLARRRRFGPFASDLLDPKGREKAIAAMIRAGHGFALSRAIVEMAPGETLDNDSLTTLR